MREIKKAVKTKAEANKTHVAAVFDLQQVIYLPKSNEGATFYKRRLACFNFTIYNLGNKDCHCYYWNESISKRGSSEISTSVFSFLKMCAENDVTKVDLFCDGCCGQNKNTIMVGMLLYAVTKLCIQEITLRFFETNHGQSEGDSAHSAIGYAIKTAGELYVPSQIVPIMRLARSSKPYIVHVLENNDLIDFKEVSKDLRILKERKDNETGDTINWTEIKEIRVQKSSPSLIEFKDSHNSDSYRSITLKRLSDKTFFDKAMKPLNQGPPKISIEKYKDLMALCEGTTPVVRCAEHVNYYKHLPH